MRLYIKNMVCDRCKMVVRAEMEKLGLQPVAVELGEVSFEEDSLTAAQTKAVKEQMATLGFEVIDDHKGSVVEQIKVAVIELVHHHNDDLRVKHSEYLAGHLRMEYAFLSKTFSEEEGMTLEQYIIQQKIEKVKELLSYGQHNLSEIAWKLNYSSVAALSSQFKKIMGITPSEYKAQDDKQRRTLDKVGG